MVRTVVDVSSIGKDVCIPFLSILESLGDPAQGLVNCLVFVAGSQVVRGKVLKWFARFFCCCCKETKRKALNEDEENLNNNGGGGGGKGNGNGVGVTHNYIKPAINSVRFNDISSLTQSSITRNSSETIDVNRTGRELCEKSDFDESEFEENLRLNYSEVESDSSSSNGKGGIRQPLLPT